MFLFHIQDSGFHYNISYIPVTVLCYILPPWPSYLFSLPFSLVSSPFPNSSLLVRMSHTNKHVRTHTSVAYGSLSNILLLIYNKTTSLPLFLFAPAKEVEDSLWESVFLSTLWTLQMGLSLAAWQQCSRHLPSPEVLIVLDRAHT